MVVFLESLIKTWRFTMKQLVLLTLSVLLLTSCGIQSIPQQKNEVDAALAEITNQYKRRSDLIPNLVNVVSGYAKHEQQTLTGVTEARARATQISVDPKDLTPEKLESYRKAQGELSAALGKLMAISENYPQLKADTGFRDLQAQLEGTENRITVARNRYIESIKLFNNLVMVVPTSWTNSLMFHYKEMPQWDVSADEKSKIEKPPEVKF